MTPTPRSPEEIRLKNRRKKNRKWWNSKEWKDLVKTKTEGKCCEECGKKAGDIYLSSKGNEITISLTLDHPDRWSYKSFELYIADQTPKRVVCQICNGMFEKGLKICPVCKARYISWRSEKCIECKIKDHPELEGLYAAGTLQQKRDQRERNKIARGKAYLDKFPCFFRRLNQRCIKKRGVRCQYNVKTCVNCVYFRWKNNQ